jgi:hypothetical protein
MRTIPDRTTISRIPSAGTLINFKRFLEEDRQAAQRDRRNIITQNKNTIEALRIEKRLRISTKMTAQNDRVTAERINPTRHPREGNLLR